jgi:hypothetical protein
VQLLLPAIQIQSASVVARQPLSCRLVFRSVRCQHVNCVTSMERNLNSGSIHIENGCRLHHSKGILSPLFQLQ